MPTNVRISNHSAGYSSCDCQAVLYFLGYRGITAREAPMKAGVAIHEAMADFLLNGSVVSAMHLFSKFYEKWSTANVPQLDRLAHDNVYKILNHWFLNNPRSSMPFEVIPEFVECGFEIPLTEDGSITFSGRPDAIVRSLNTKRVYIVDHKSVGYLSDDWIQKYKLDPQMSGYMWMAEQYGLEVSGIYINAIEVRRLSDSPRTCPTHKVPKKECDVQHVNYKFLPFTRELPEIEGWRTTILEIAKHYRELLDKCPDICYIDQIPMQGRFHGTCNSCQFFEFCASSRKPSLADKLMKREIKHA